MAQDVLSNGFVRLCIDPSLNFYDGACRILVVGQAFDGPTETLTPNVIAAVNNERDLAEMFGVGSVLTEALRVVLCACPANLQVAALPLADPAAGAGVAAAVYAMTITGPAASDGRFTLFMGNDRYIVDFPVLEGETATQIGDKLVDAIPVDFPYEATNVAGVVSFTAKHAGTIGNYFNPVYNWAGRRNYAPAGVTVETTVTTPGTGAPVVPDLINLTGECCYDVVIYLGDDDAGKASVGDYLKDAWSCDKPQCFGHGYIYDAGTLGQVLAKASNSPELSRLAYAIDSFDLPYLTIANYGALSACISCTNPETSVQGPENGLLNCIALPQSCSSPWTYDERMQLQDNGFVTYGPSGFGSGELTNPLIYNDVTNYLYDELGRANATFRDTNSRRLSMKTAIEIAEQMQTYNGLALFTRNTKIREGVKGTNLRLMLADIRTWAKGRVGLLFSEFENIDTDIRLRSDADVAAKCRGNPGLIHLDFRYYPPVRISQIRTNLQPKLLDNCDR